MKYFDLIQQCGSRPFFETEELILWFDEPAAQVQARLSRWVRQDKLVQLRRGKYLLPKRYRTSDPAEIYLANYLYKPSYVSLYSALQYYQCIPERVQVWQSVTSRQTNCWDTPIGTFRYASIKQDWFFGYDTVSLGPGEQHQGVIATLEKAFIDLFYLQTGEWSSDRLEEMRFQNMDQVDWDRLRAFASRMNKPKIRRAVNRISEMFEYSESAQGRTTGSGE